MKKILLVLLFIPLVSFGQNDGYKLCFEIGNRSFNTNKDAKEALQKVLSVANLKTNRFVILPCDNIGNAMAAVYEGFRYILYKESWLSQSNYWSKMAVLAHEVGHHINGHTLSGYSLAESRRVELEADDWAGYAMGVLGASLIQTLELTERFSEGDDTNSTHPNRAKRINALTAGWNIGSEKVSLSSSNKVPDKYVPDNSNMSATEYWNRAYDKSENGDNYGAIADYTKAIELNPNSSSAYSNRGLLKDNLEDLYGAIADYTKAIELDPDNADIYFNRGISKSGLKDLYGAIADYTKAIELDPDDASAYSNRGISKKNLKDYYGAIADYTKAIELNPDYAFAYSNRGVSKSKLKDNYGAIADFTKAIELDPDYVNAYSNRGISKENIGDLNGACKDWRKAASLGHSNSAKWVGDQCN